MWFHKYLACRGYCSVKKPKLHKRIRKNGEIFFFYRINSYTFSSLNWVHDMFYQMDKTRTKLVKIIPQNIGDYLTPLALAVWFMDDGSKLKQGARLATNSFTLEEIHRLCQILNQKYNIIATANKGGVNKGYIIYINVCSMPIFVELVKPYVVKSLSYKLGDY